MLTTWVCLKVPGDVKGQRPWKTKGVSFFIALMGSR